MESLESVSGAIKQHVDACNSFRNIWFGIAVIVAGYMVAMGVYASGLQSSIRDLTNAQMADRKNIQEAMAAERQRITDAMAYVTNAQIDRTRQAVEAVNKSDGTTREELRALRQEIKELREKIEAVHGISRR